MLKVKGDNCMRAGLTTKPIATNETQSVQVLRALLRTFDFIMKVIVHTLAGIYTWSESKTSINYGFLESEKKKLQDEISLFCGE